MKQYNVPTRPIFDAGFNSLLNDFFGDINVYDRKQSNQKWNRVPVNILETEGSYDLEVVAPGMNKSDFKINIEKNLLTIEASKETVQEEKTENKAKTLRTEYNFSSFKRSFTLDDKIDTTSIQAKYENGVLRLNLPKKVEVKEAVKQINIQ